MIQFDPKTLHAGIVQNNLSCAADIAVLLVQSDQANLKRQLLVAYEQVRRASYKARHAIFSDPRATLWLRGAGAKIASCKELSIDELEQIISDFSVFALSAALIDGANWHQEVPTCYRERFVLPGTIYSVSIPPEARHACLAISSDRNLTANGFPIAREEVVHCDNLQLISSEEYLWPENDYGIPPISSDELDVGGWTKTLHQAGKLVGKHQQSKDLVERFGRLIIPVQSKAQDTHCSASFSSRLGILYMSWLSSAELIAEAIVHESDHQLFYVLTGTEALWVEPVNTQPCIYRSPWRDDPRPLDGLLRGASAFIRVAEFWDGVLPQTSERQAQSDAGRRCVLSLEQSLDAIATIHTHGLMTKNGIEFVNELQSRAQKVQISTQAYDNYPAWKAEASARQYEQNQKWLLRTNSEERFPSKQ